ncbi:hypothetical protein [Priestia taiwanensis]|uniref:Uncharacterized protein n=1 Tax=Priestia taiwanensis TaxID=1347902 RepID=A0A917EPD4_9BACI|nr:hypothetical protein [Priestia taiwanensis]MBM7363149.1 tetraacyldisaccharide-1-P 4'-kinase [Priestia taiwanensis]GGE68104.1 hypothetical protein GCM10007140_17690 [Priestia taiwanensis]
MQKKPFEIIQSLFKWLTIISMFFLILNGQQEEGLVERIAWALLPLSIWLALYAVELIVYRKTAKSFAIMTAIASAIIFILCVGNLIFG